MSDRRNLEPGQTWCPRCDGEGILGPAIDDECPSCGGAGVLAPVPDDAATHGVQFRTADGHRLDPRYMTPEYTQPPGQTEPLRAPDAPEATDG